MFIILIMIKDRVYTLLTKHNFIINLLQHESQSEWKYDNAQHFIVKIDFNVYHLAGSSAYPFLV
jgi:hypothetical protein